MYTEIENEKETESEADINPETMEVMEVEPEADELNQLRERDQNIRNLGESILKQMAILEQKKSEVKAEQKRLEVLQDKLAELAVEKPEGQMKMDCERCEIDDDDKAAGMTEEAIRAEFERGKAQRLAGEDNEPIRDAEKVSRMIKNCDSLLDKIDDPNFDPETVASIKAQLVFDGFYTPKQQKALDHIAREWLK